MRNIDWLCEHNNGLWPENCVRAESGDSNDGKVIQNGEKYKLADTDDANALLEPDSNLLEPDTGGTPKVDACGRMSAEDFAQAISDGMEKLNAAIESNGKPHDFYAFDELDTREKLEADVRTAVNAIYEKGCIDGDLRDKEPVRIGFKWITNLLDRQAAITERECEEREEELSRRFWKRVEEDDLDIAKLTAERDKQAERIRQLEQVVQADKEDCAQAFADMKVTENQRDGARIERDWLVREVNGLMKNQPYAYDPKTPIASLKTLGRYIGEQSEKLDAVLRKLDDEKQLTSTYRRERDLYRKKLGDAVWHAQAIARMAEVD